MVEPFYQNWTFWAVIVSAVAIVLSQVPPVLTWFKKARLDVELYSKISITHKVGNPNLQLHVCISNIGGRKVRIKNVKTAIRRDGARVVELPVQNYLQHPNDQNTVLFTSFTLKPEEEWSHIINLLQFFNREDENEYRRAESEMQRDIWAKREQYPDPETRPPIEAEEDITNFFIKFFENRFIWLPGEYELQIEILTDQTLANVSKKYRFTIFESQSDQQRRVTEHYKYGAGIYWEPEPSLVVTNTIIDLTEF